MTIFLAERARASGSSSSDRNKEAASPFAHTSHGNPAFTPQKATGKSSANVTKYILAVVENHTILFLIFSRRLRAVPRRPRPRKNR